MERLWSQLAPRKQAGSAAPAVTEDQHDDQRDGNDRARWSGHYVQLEDTWATGFEISRLGGFGGSVWLDGYDGIKVVCAPKRPKETRIEDAKTYQVRVTGFIYTAGHYGHMGTADALIVATELVYLDPSRPECK